LNHSNFRDGDLGIKQRRGVKLRTRSISVKDSRPRLANGHARVPEGRPNLPRRATYAAPQAQTSLNESPPTFSTHANPATKPSDVTFQGIIRPGSKRKNGSMYLVVNNTFTVV
jgi:hypothetical protein